MIRRFLHRYGFGIQSPWAYSLVRDVLFESLRYYAFDDLRHKHPHLSRKERKRNEQLFRIVNHFKPSDIITAGNCPPATLDYLQQKGTEGTVLLYYFGPESSKETIPTSIPDDAVVVIDDISRSNQSLWEQLLQNPRATAVFEMGYRGMMVFDPKRIRQTYQL